MKISVESTIERTPRAVQLEGLFDIPSERISRVEWDVDLPLDEKPWQIGLITGPSGSGKSTIARELFGAPAANRWPRDKPVIDGFPAGMSIRDVTGLLSSVGFASPPSWLRPYRVLSTGEKFRADVALTLAKASAGGRDIVLVDEFTSVVDRTVAKVGSSAIAKTIRRGDQRFVAVTCHEDVTDWLQPDWVYHPATGAFEWRSVQPRPALDFSVERSPRSLWRLFAPHHYLSRDLSSSARLFVAWHDDEPIACYAIRRFPHAQVRNAWESCRVVVLPDWQGVGIASALLNLVGGAVRQTRARLILTAAHPAMVAALARRPEWAVTRRAGFVSKDGGEGNQIRSKSARRMVVSFEYVGPAVESPLCEHVTIGSRRALTPLTS